MIYLPEATVCIPVSILPANDENQKEARCAPPFAAWWLDVGSPSEDERNDEQHHEDREQQLRDARGCPCDTAKAKDARDDCHDQE